MPAAPPEEATKLFQTRACPPRWQAMILPAKTLGSAGIVPHSASLYPGTLAAITTGAGPAPSVIEAPTAVNLSPFDAVRLSVETNSRVWVEAATEVVHGARWLTVPAPGPELPAEVETNTPAA